MEKGIRKANARLEQARKYVERFMYYTVPCGKPTPSVKTVKVEPEPKPQGWKVESAEIKKLEKGYFFVVLTYGGRRHEIEKRFKSITKAKEWISNHEYV